jgi:hypothetical protein
MRAVLEVWAVLEPPLRFFVFGLFGRQQPRRRAKRFTMVEERQIAHVQRQRAARALLVDDDGYGASFDAFAETNAAAASEARVREPFQHPEAIILQERLDLALDLLL